MIFVDVPLSQPRFRNAEDYVEITVDLDDSFGPAMWEDRVPRPSQFVRWFVNYPLVI